MALKCPSNRKRLVGKPSCCCFCGTGTGSCEVLTCRAEGRVRKQLAAVGRMQRSSKGSSKNKIQLKTKSERTGPVKNDTRNVEKKLRNSS